MSGHRTNLISVALIVLKEVMLKYKIALQHFVKISVNAKQAITLLRQAKGFW